ncbi:MAG: alpha/beta hydrolase family protein [Verrucomicrobiota bacterium]
MPLPTHVPFLVVLLSLASTISGALSQQNTRPLHSDLTTNWPPKNTYGSLEHSIQQIRDHRPLDLNAERWKASHPDKSIEDWQALALACLRDGLHYDPEAVPLDATVLQREENEDLIRELVEFNTTPWFRVRGYFLMPRDAKKPLPGLLVLHAWGGPMLFGKERIVNTGRDHPVLQQHRDKYYDGTYLAEEMAKAGYAVLTIDNYHFGERCPRGVGGVPKELDPFDLSEAEYQEIEHKARELVYLGVRQLNWAGTTWAGVNYGDDRASISYLQSRSEVDPDRVGCTGLSGGAWRTNMLVALDERIKAAVSVGWMTTGDYQQVYNVRGAVRTFNLLPGIWNRMDIPDLIALAAPTPVMVVVGTKDTMVPTEGVIEANRQMQSAYTWAGHPNHFRAYNPPKIHCYDREIREEAIRWLDKHLN